MLSSLGIENFILIDKAFIEWPKGFTVLTGETGAGKSIILDALKIALGSKASIKMLKDPSSPALITAEFEYCKEQINPLLEEAGLLSQESLLIRRIINADGKNKVFINDQQTSISFIQKLGTHLIEIFGQNDHHSLLSSNMHRDTLDKYIKSPELIKLVSESYSTWKTLEKEFERLFLSQKNSQLELDYLTHTINELENINYSPGELEALDQKRKFLLDYNKIQDLINEAEKTLKGNNLSSDINRLSRSLMKQEKVFTEVISALETISIEIDEAYNQLQIIMDNYNDQADLNEIENRFFALKGIAKKYNISVDQIPDVLESKKAELIQINNLEDTLSNIEKEKDKAQRQFFEIANKLSEKRKEGAIKLEQRVMNELRELHMSEAQFFVKIIPQDANPFGIDRITFEVITNPGGKSDVIQNVASGGEISRIMLALKVSLSEVNSVDTLIFDEIDTGIGGAVATSVGVKLRKLSTTKQVLSVTHQPQIASIASTQYQVQKTIIDNNTFFSINLLDDQNRVKEIARMLTGNVVSTQSHEAAEALLNHHNK